MIENDEPGGIDEILCELDCSIKKLSAAVIEQFMLRFTQDTLSLVYRLVNMLTNNELQNLSFEIQENIITIVGLLPRLYENKAKNIQKDQFLNIENILLWISNNANSYK